MSNSIYKRIISEDFDVEELAKKNCSLSTDQNIKVSICTELTDKLINEGIVRDFIRNVQNHRKESNFDVEDRISIQIICDDKFYAALNKNIDYFKNETLCMNLNRVSIIDDMSNSLKISSQNVELAIKRL